jgi:cytochrome c biogenesis protein CcmG/thiol:disulfide interchange protein DsbE
LSTAGSLESTIDVIRKVLASAVVAALLVAYPVVSSADDNLQLSDYQGKVVVLDFWASWCVPCRRSFPWMNTMQEKYADDGLVIIAVNLDNEVSEAKAFLQQYPAKFQIFYDHDRQLARQLAVEAMPSSFLIGRDGEVSERHLGFKSAKTDEYEAAIVAALRKPL